VRPVLRQMIVGSRPRTRRLAGVTRRWLSAVLVGCWLPTFVWADGPESNPGTPLSAASLKELEHRVRDAAKKALPSVVAVEGAMSSPNGDKGFASGVIITADGLVLSQYHVSHMLDQADYQKSRKPGERTKVILHDGRTREAELLGAARSYDLSLLRLIQPGPYPHAPLDDKATVKSGDVVLKIGHPMGYRPGRAPVVRAGRVLYVQDDSFVSDCLMIGGDSGGPFFDLDGRLVGIVRNSLVPETLRESLGERYTGFIPFANSTNSLICGRIAAMRRGELAEVDRNVIVRSMERIRNAQVIPADRWTQGSIFRAVYRETVKQARLSVVAVQDGDEVAALGTVVGAEGWVVTKASQLPAEPTCRLPDGRVLAARVVGVDPAFDVALLKIPAADLSPVQWADETRPVVGTFLAAPGPEELPRAVGVVSVPRRDLPGPFPARIEPPRRQRATLPELIGSAVQGRGYWVEFVEGMAAAAGIQPGDVILTIAGKAVRRHQDLADCVEDRWASERVAVRLLRAGKPLDLTMRLRAEGASPFNLRSGDFPTMFEHDAPLLARECGGPVVDLTGKAVGITIARGFYGCTAIPSDCIQRLLPDLKSGKLAPHWIAYRETLLAQAPTAPPAKPMQAKPATLTLDEIKQKLRERRERFKSLLVEYQVVSEAHVEPRLLSVWNLCSLRDYEERHRVAFAGAKQFAEILDLGVRVYNLPEDRMVPDPNAPASLTERIERQQRTALARKQQGLSTHLFSSTQGDQKRLIFDGTYCFVWREVGNRMVPLDATYFSSPTMEYLAGLGLRPLDPQPRYPEMRKSQQQYWFPDNFALYDKCRVGPNEETLDGASCIVVEAERYGQSEGKRQLISDRFWFDAKLGFAPRKWERRVDGTLADLWANAEFEEFAPGCWLPWKSTWTRGTPAWVSPELRNRPALSYNMQLRKAQVNCVRDDLFKP